MKHVMNERNELSTPKLVLYGIGISLLALLFGKKRRFGPTSDREERFAGDRKSRRMIFQGWLIVCGISLAFVAYGIFAFRVVGDKGPSDWDFGGVQDIPGGSEYSTYPYRGASAETEPQHVYQKPADAKGDLLGPPPTPGTLFEGAEHEGPGKGSWRGEYGPGKGEK